MFRLTSFPPLLSTTPLSGQKMLLLALFAGFLSYRAVKGQSIHTVNVGVEGSFYDPPTTEALEGDIIHFVFGGLIHDVTQATFNTPCLPMPGGFSSGLAGINGSTTFSAPTWDLKISNASEPIWFFCQATRPESHCQAGMVGAINPPSVDMFTSFQNAAKSPIQTPTPTPTVVLTGQGAFAAGPPTSVPLPSGSTLSLPGGTGFLPTSSASTTAAPSPTAGTTHGSSNVGLIAGAAAGGTAAVVIIAGLSILLYRSRRNKKSIPRPGADVDRDMIDRNLLAESPYANAATFSRGPSAVAYASYGNDKYHRGQSPPAPRSSSPIDIGRRPTIDQLSEPSFEEAQQELRYANSRNDLRSLTLQDAMYPQVHPYAQGEFRPMPDRQQATTRAPEVNVHELAKEVAALINPQPTTAPAPVPPAQAHGSMPTRGRTAAVRQLPNPVRSPVNDNESVLPRYER